MSVKTGSAAAGDVYLIYEHPVVEAASNPAEWEEHSAGVADRSYPSSNFENLYRRSAT